MASKRRFQVIERKGIRSYELAATVGGAYFVKDTKTGECRGFKSRSEARDDARARNQITAEAQATVTEVQAEPAEQP